MRASWLGRPRLDASLPASPHPLACRAADAQAAARDVDSSGSPPDWRRAQHAAQLGRELHLSRRGRLVGRHTAKGPAPPRIPGPACRDPVPCACRDKDAEQQLAATRRQQREEREERQKALDATWEA